MMKNTLIGVLLSLAAVSAVARSLPVAEKCSPTLLQPPALVCGGISPSRSQELKAAAGDSLDALGRLMQDTILTTAVCHPDYLNLTTDEVGLSSNPPVLSYSDVGCSVPFLRSIYPNVSLLTVSESMVRIDGGQIYFDAELREAGQYIVDALASLVELVGSDLDLTQGSNCELPPESCFRSYARTLPPLRDTGAQFTASQERYRELIVTARTLKNYANDLHRRISAI